MGFLRKYEGTPVSLGEKEEAKVITYEDLPGKKGRVFCLSESPFGT